MDRFIAELHRKAAMTSNPRFSMEKLLSIAQDMNLRYDRFQDLVESLNHHGREARVILCDVVFGLVLGSL